MKKEILKRLKAIDREKLRLEQARDNIREQIQEIEELLSTVDDACEEFAEGMSLLISATDTLSQYM